MADKYKNNSEIRRIFRCFLNLSFFKNTRRWEAYDYILEQISFSANKNIFDPFIEYFKKTYFGGDGINPNFSFEFWSVADRIVSDYPRTTNNLEAWHNWFNNLVDTAHPNIGRFINALQIETEKTRIRLARYKNGVLELGRCNYEREAKLKMLMANESFISIKDLFISLDVLNGWPFDN